VQKLLMPDLELDANGMPKMPANCAHRRCCCRRRRCRCRCAERRLVTRTDAPRAVDPAALEQLMGAGGKDCSLM
jgi:hypothetical protein